MNSFWLKNKYRIIAAVGLAVLYLCILGGLWVESGGRGERAGGILFILNFPLLIIPMIVGWSSSSEMAVVMFYGLGGTFQWALIGWLIGPILRIFVYDEPKQQAINNPLSRRDDHEEGRTSDESK